MTTVKHLIQEKGGTVWSVTPETPIYEALQLMADKDVGVLMVLEKDHIAGIFSERDYARKVILAGKSSKDTPVRQIMTADVITVRINQTLQECMAIMARRRIRHLPVLDGEHVAGMLSIGDVVTAIMAEQENDIQRLENAMMGSEELLD